MAQLPARFQLSLYGHVTLTFCRGFIPLLLSNGSRFTMTTQQPAAPQTKRGIVKQVNLSVCGGGDPLWGILLLSGGLLELHTPEKQVNFSGITAPKLARRAGDS
ncbi:hypothetical protein NQ317_019351 [Molorchus minor]|uniref:Uncharacterized protein n=1 Tax=Molorchus minor TaxID=1323400 RepID=A0ABQ9J9E9_9CUCU|nr:hypothetical protein NQ317_019351 [Molorchus minor]